MIQPGSDSESNRFPVLVIGDTGGAHVRIRALAMAALGYEIHALTPRPSSEPALHEISLPASTGDVRAIPGDIAHVHFASNLGAWAFVASGDPRPLAVSVMGGDVLFDEQGDASPWTRWLVRQVLLRADFVTAKSDYLAVRLRAMGVPADRIETVLWGVDRALFRPGDKAQARRALGLPEAAPVVFSPRILKPFYRTDVIIRALAQLRGRHADARLVVAEYEADPAFRRELGDLARSLGFGAAVTFAGVIPFERMPDYYAAADVAVGIPPSDGMPQTVFEAMACGTPSVVARLARYEEVLTDRETALFADPTPEGVAAGILELLDDAALAAGISENGRRLVADKAELGRDAARVSAIYQRLRALGPRRPRPLWARLLARALVAAAHARNRTPGESRRIAAGPARDGAIGVGTGAP